jgi:oligoribonuclease NrnB/cAMP/cGMP phosphodiesterase (DHH superfamily)
MDELNIVMYHNHCTDGFGAAYAAWTVLGDNARYIPMSYGYIEKGSDKRYLSKEEIKGKIIYILDFSVPNDYRQHLAEHCERLVWLDHHEDSFALVDSTDTVFEWSDGKQNILLDQSRSGALITWNWFHRGEAPALITMIDDRDRWVFKHEDSRALHAGLEAMKPWSFKQWQELNLSFAINRGLALLEMKEVHYDAITGASKRAISIDVVVDGVRKTYKGLSANAPPFYASEIGNRLATESDTFGMTWYMSSHGYLGVSFRSLDGVTAKILANSFGGGGHGNAAGCRMTVEQLLERLE